MVVGVGLQPRDILVGDTIHGNILGHVVDGVGHLGVDHLGEAGGGGDPVP